MSQLTDEAPSRRRSVQPSRKTYQTAWLYVALLTAMAFVVASHPPPPADGSPEWCSLGMYKVEERCCEDYPGRIVRVYPQDQKLLKFLNDTRYEMDVEWSFEFIADNPPASVHDDIYVIIIYENWGSCFFVIIHPAMFGGDDRAFGDAMADCDIRGGVTYALDRMGPHFREGRRTGFPCARPLQKPFADRITARANIREMESKFFGCKGSTCCMITDHRWGLEDPEEVYRCKHQMLQNAMHYLTVDLEGRPLKLEHWIRPRISCSLYSASNGKRMEKLCHGITDIPEPC